MQRPRYRLAGLATCAVVTLGLAACGSASSDDNAQKAWDPAALTVAAGLAKKVRGSGSPCTKYDAWDFATLAADYRNVSHLPVPAAVTQCTGKDDENLTFSVFADERHKQDFVDAKTKLICDAAKRKNLQDVTLPYVDGGTWILEPDEQSTADKLAPALGATSAAIRCG